MKRLFYTKTLIALAVAVAAAAAAVSQAQEQPIPPPSNDTALPASVVPGSPLADVVKMIQAGVDPSTIKTYIGNVQNPFNLDADTIIYLKDLGAPSDVINAMMDRDKALSASNVTPPSPPAQPTAPPVDTTPNTAPPPDGTPDTAPPPTEVTVNYFNDTLTPYGTWVDAEGYGRCWRPTVAIYNSGWSPYCDGGHWVYTDCGWYWDSDYSWGVAFHYGRWFRSPRLGWCWYPDTVWAPSWVVWRSSDDYCGWAPLPPFAVFHPGVGFFYRGFNVGVDFDFGLAADCFVFVPPHHFCDWHPRSFCVDHEHVTQVFHQTTVINNYTVNNTTIVNQGIRPDRIASVTHRPIEPVRVGSLPNAGRQGWRGEGYERTMHPAPGGHNPPGNNNPGHGFTTGNAPGGNPIRHGPEPYNSPGTPPGAVHHDPSVPGSQLVHQTEPGHPQGQPPQSGNGSHGQPQTYVHQQPTSSSSSSSSFSVPRQQPQPSQQPRQNNAYAQPNYVTSQNQRQQPQQQYQPSHQTYAYPEPSRGNSQNQWSQNQNQNQWQQNQSQQNRNAGTAFPDPAQQHGAGQLQQRESVPPEQPRQAPPPNYGQPQGQYHQPPAQPAPQGQPQPHNAGNGSGNGGSNRQNH